MLPEIPPTPGVDCQLRRHWSAWIVSGVREWREWLMVRLVSEKILSCSADIAGMLHQQKKCLLRTDRHCVRTQEIRLEPPVRPAHPQRALAEWLHPSPLCAIQPASCPPSVPGWAISHPNLPKNTKVSDQCGFAMVISPCPWSPLLTTDYFITRQRLFRRKRSLT